MKNAAKFTPGPWKYQSAPKHQHAIDRKFEVVADCDGGQMVIVGEHTGIDCLTEANARLIASAPALHAENAELRAVNAELLAALRSIATTCREIDDSGRIIQPNLKQLSAAYKAISRATGRQQ